MCNSLFYHMVSPNTDPRLHPATRPYLICQSACSVLSVSCHSCPQTVRYHYECYYEFPLVCLNESPQTQRSLGRRFGATLRFLTSFCSSYTGDFLLWTPERDAQIKSAASLQICSSPELLGFYVRVKAPFSGFRRSGSKTQ